MMLETLIIFISIVICIVMIRYRWKKKPKDSLTAATIRQHNLQEEKQKKAYMKKKMKSSDQQNNLQPNTLAATNVGFQNDPQPSTSATSSVIDDDVSESSIIKINFCNNPSNTIVAPTPLTQAHNEETNVQSNSDLDEISSTNEYYTDDESSSNDSDSCDNRETSTAPTLEQFQKDLASTFINANVSHSQGNAILTVLRTHPCFINLPRATKTLLQTPRTPLQTIRMGSGEYFHIGLEDEIIKKLETNLNFGSIQYLIIDIHTDGMSPHRSSHTQIWPIQFRIINILNDKPGIIGVYLGKTKPKNSTEFFKYFIDEYQAICAARGINYKDRLIPVHIRCFIADAPARALILNHRGHNSTRPCSKCTVTGQSINRTMCFLQIQNQARTIEEYVNCTDRIHHLPNNESALKYIGLNMITDVPFEYMHLICLGVVKKFLSAILDNKYSFPSLTKPLINIISSRLLVMQTYCPHEFSRRPRSISDYLYYKATEFRQFLLYTGPVVLHNILQGDAYDQFLLLHTACRVLLISSPSEAHLEYAQIALKVYVQCCAEIYGPKFLSYNIHCLLHVVDDVRRFGNLNSYSAFPYEDNMTFFKKYLRKPEHLLQQLRNRLAEQHHQSIKTTQKSEIKPLHKHSEGPILQNVESSNIVQYKGLRFEHFRLMSNNDRDDCVILKCGQICKVLNITKNIVTNHYNLIVNKFHYTDNYYKIAYGIDSYYAGVYICENLSTSIESVDLNELYAKCFKMPYWDGESINENKNVVMTLLSNC